jgi:hypothetical protein
VRYVGFINLGKNLKFVAANTHPTNKETTNKETGFLSAFWVGDKDLGKKPGF